MTRWLTKVLVGTLFVMGLMAVEGLPAEAATSPTQSYVTMFSEPHDGLADHVARTFTSARDSISIIGTTADLEVEVRGADGDWFDFRFSAAQGQKLAVGSYLHAEWGPYTTGEDPVVDIMGNGTGCNRVSGQFRILDIAPDLSRLWLVYEHHCEELPGALFGEIRYGMSTVDPAVSVSGSQVVWPQEYVGWAGRPAEVVLRATSTSSVAVANAAVTGTGFTLLGNTCPATLLPGKECRLTVGFKPTTVGTRLGTVSVEANGRSRRVQLEGTGFMPTSTWLSQGDTGSYLGNGLVELSTDYPRSQSVAYGSGTTTTAYMSGYNDATTEGNFSARFQAPPGQQLVPGATYTNIVKYPATAPGAASMNVTAWERECDTISGSFTVRSATFDGSEMTSSVIDFVQYCNGQTAAYRGSLYANTSGRPSVVASTTSAAATRATVSYGSTTSVSGILRAGSSAQPVPGAGVALYSRVVGSSDWRYRGSATTAADGSYSFSQTPTRNVDFRVQHFGSLATLPSRSAALRVSVRPRVALASSRSSARVGASVRLRAGLTPARAGHPVLLQRYTGGAWKTVQRVDQPTTGPAVFTVRMRLRGWYMFRAVTPADESLLQGTSVSVRVKVS